MRTRMKRSQIKEGVWVLNRNRPERGIYQCIARINKSGDHFSAKKFGSSEIVHLKTRLCRLATPEEIAQIVRDRINDTYYYEIVWGMDPEQRWNV